MLISLAHYQTCATAAIHAAGRSRGAAAANSRHHAQRLLSAFDALGPWKADEEEPEPEELEVEEPEQPSAAQLRTRSDDDRMRDLLAACTHEWQPLWVLQEAARIKRGDAHPLLDQLTASGRIERRQAGPRASYYRIAA